jgi:hypothetical protein
MKKLYFENGDKATSLIELLTLGFSYGDVYFVPTYLDKQLTYPEYKFHAKRRSFEDLLVIANTYFPNTSEEDLMKALMEYGIHYYFCSNIKKIVFHKVQAFLGTIYQICYDEFNQYGNNKYQEGTYTSKQLREIYEKVKLSVSAEV